MNKTLADAARAAVTDPDFERQKGYCQRFIRQVLEKVYGGKYAAYMKTSARETGDAFAHAGLGLSPAAAQPLQPGDLLFKRHIVQSNGKVFPYGHVGVFVGGSEVAENSSTSLGRIQGAKGYRTLDEFGHYDLVVRLPDPHAAPAAPPAADAPARIAASLHTVKAYDRNSHTLLWEALGTSVSAEVVADTLIVRVG